MHFDYSIETLSEKIQNSKTKQYFREVYQTYINGNYRSSIVMLYSVLICDLVFKLRDLRDIYADSKAKNILKEIEEMQAANPNSPDWERKLIDLIKEKTNLLETSDFISIDFLQKSRHLSAHPVLSNSDLLFSPNKETVQSLIRNTLEGVLTNPPFFSNKIFDTMLSDLDEVQESVSEDDSLEKYVVSRYISRLKDNDYLKVFRSLWKVVFIAADDLAKKNTFFNYRVLKIFVKQRKDLCIEIIKKEPNFYSNVTNEVKIRYVIKLLAHYPDFYSVLESSTQLLIQKQSKNSGNLEFISWFLSKNLISHFSGLEVSLISDLGAKYIKFMEKICIDNGFIHGYCDFLIKYFSESSSFEQASTRLKNIDNILKKHIDLKQSQELLRISNLNSQIYGSYFVPDRIREVTEHFENDFDKKAYPKIFTIKD